MAKYQKKPYQLGECWLSQRSGSPAYYRTWYADGKTHRVSLGTSDVEEAKRLLKEWFLANQKHTSDPLMADVLEKYWLNHGQHTRSKSTAKTHKRYWVDEFGSATVAEATTFNALERFKAKLIAKGLKPQTVNHILSLGKRALRHSWQRGDISSVPPFKMLPVGEQEPMGRPLTPQESGKLMAHLSGHVWLLSVILLGTLCRPGAAMELTWEQIDWEANLIDLSGGKIQNKKYRPVVRMPAFLREILWFHSRDGELKPKTGPVVAFRGEAVKSVKTSFRKALKRSGLGDDVNLYSWRHGVAREMRRMAVPYDEIQYQLGHRRPGVTDRYAALDPRYQQAATLSIQAYWEACQTRATENAKREADQLPKQQWVNSF